MKLAREILINVIANFIAAFLGMLLAFRYGDSILFEALSYQEGWYRTYGYYLLISTVVFILYLLLLVRQADRFWPYLLIIPTLAIFVYARTFIPLGRDISAIEFVFFWCLIAQITAIALVSAYRVWKDLFRR